MTYKTPGVYVKEISIFPPSVAEVETAVPAFIGFTEKAVKKGVDLKNVPTRISSLLEFQQYFGGGSPVEEIIVTLDDANVPQKAYIDPTYYMYDSIRLFFDNGGGDAYIVSIGSYDDLFETAAFTAGLNALKKYDEPTIILFPDAVLLPENDLYGLQAAALQQCEELMDRVAVLDVPSVADDGSDLNDVVDAFRSGIGTKGLKYGAAYTPFLRTKLKPTFNYEQLTLKRYRVLGPGEDLDDLDDVDLADISSGQARTDVEELENAMVDRDTVMDFLTDPLSTGDDLVTGYANLPNAAANDETEVTDRLTHLQDLIKAAAALVLTNTNLQAKLQSFSDGKLKDYHQRLLQYEFDFNDLFNPDLNIITPNDPFTLTVPGAATPTSIYAAAADMSESGSASRSAFQSFFDQLNADLNAFLDEILNEIDNREQELVNSNAIYAALVDAINKEGSVLPPSGAVAGLYAYVDNTRGVWKAPANVSISSVNGPTVVIDDKDQERLNIDVNGGKSVNAIRSFVGRGTLVWGARTLAGNDNEWRYVPVRRFFNMVEESVKKSTSWAVFEPNTANTWTKVKTMIDNYLIQKWRDGALAGAKPDEAFFVKVGLGLTMTPQDILEGRMIVEIGMAVVRPAEFIILKFSHKLQES